MKRLSLEELRKHQLDILDATAKFCDENQISYFLDGGTLIGAIRHKGYIPWDDDIDIGMLRPDYDKFSRLFNASNSRYKFSSVEIDDNYCLPYGKVFDTRTLLYEPDKTGNKSAVNIDVFVFDNAPDNPSVIRKMFKKRDLLMLCCLLRISDHKPRGNFFRRLFLYFTRLILKLFPRNFFARRIIANSKLYGSKQTKNIGNFAGYIRAICNREILRDFVDAEFEGRTYKIPANYDEWLRLFYGDYMQLPPVEQRVSHHRFEAYINE